MWIPSLIDMFYSDMQTYGVKMTKEQIYSTNNSSLKDAVIQFNGGCTAEIVSDQGLILTNHHCGYDAIQKHSTIEKDYLANGFWSKNFSEELPCPWLNVTIVKEIRDVTEAVFKGIDRSGSAEEIQKAIQFGVRKINIDTDIRLAMTGAVRKFLAENPDKFDAREWLKPARSAAQAICKQRYIEFGCEGQAGKIQGDSLQVVAAKYAKGELSQVVH